jgi:hypothetical protein
MRHLIPRTVLTVLLAAGIARAHTSSVVERTCPLCEKAFTCQLDMSGTQFGMRLDLKPIGPIAAPWRIPVCPTCRFVVYADDISADELAICRRIVASPAYKEHADRASYFLLGLLYEGIGKSHDMLTFIFLKASWQEEENTERLQDDLQRSLTHFEAWLKQPAKETGPVAGEQPDEPTSRGTAALLKGELLRRLGRFEAAQTWFSNLQTQPRFQQTFLGQLVRFEITLCKQKDARPHPIADAETAAQTDDAPAADADAPAATAKADGDADN